MDPLLIISLFLNYIFIARLVGLGMYNVGFNGGRTTVLWIGGATWPLTIWLYLSVVIFEYDITLIKKKD